MTDFMTNRNMEEDMAEVRHLWRLGVSDTHVKGQSSIFYCVSFPMEVSRVVPQRLVKCWDIQGLVVHIIKLL